MHEHFEVFKSTLESLEEEITVLTAKKDAVIFRPIGAVVKELFSVSYRASFVDRF